MGLLSKLRPGDKTVFVFIGLASAALAFLLYWMQPWLLVLLGLKATDAMFVFRGAVPPPDKVAVVAIDEKSVNDLGRWPWSRDVTARLIERLKPARVAALDIVFSEPQNDRADAALGGSLKKSGNIVAGYFFRNDSTDIPGDAAMEQIKSSAIRHVEFVGGENPEGSIDFTGLEFAGVEPNIPVVGRYATGYGSFNIVPQDDGNYRVANLLFKYGDNVYPSLSLEALSRYYGEEIVVNLASYGIDSIKIKDRNIPVDEEGGITLNFYGKGGSFKTYSASDVISGAVGEKELKDKLVFVGVTEKAIYDIRPTPVDSVFPGVEIHATIAGNVLSGKYLIRDSRVVILDLAMMLLLPFVLTLAISYVHRTYAGLLIFVVMSFGVFALGYYAFVSYDLKVGLVFPLIALSLTYIADEAYRNIVIEKKGRQLKKAFSTYVAPDLVAEIIKNPDKLKLGGGKRVITVLFSDIRGFTTLSENLKPEDLVTLLNEYLNPMTAIVLENRGMVDKYIGDAIMAIFNAPLDLKDHARLCCTAALQMIPKLEALNADWVRKGYPRIDIGIGINTGEAVVGNMGSELKFDYTCIGDTVNLASRLEGLNKMYGTAIVVSENTYAEVKEHFIFREIDLVQVKGKHKPVALFELLDFKDTGMRRREDFGAHPGAASITELCERFAEALALFRHRKFPEAKALFEKIFDDFPDDTPSALYVKRCERCIEYPPLDDWNGVFVATTK